MLRLPHSTLVPIRRLIAGLFGTLPLIMMLMGGLPNVASALQMQNADLVSPVTGNVFPVIVVPANQNGGDTLADMGADDDGCRHSSGASEYDYYVATDPTSYFSALTAEWDEKSSPARFRPISRPGATSSSTAISRSISTMATSWRSPSTGRRGFLHPNGRPSSSARATSRSRRNTTLPSPATPSAMPIRWPSPRSL